jgi:hypothetical protein
MPGAATQAMRAIGEERQRRTSPLAGRNPKGDKGLRRDCCVTRRLRYHRIDSSSRLAFTP